MQKKIRKNALTAVFRCAEQAEVLSRKAVCLAAAAVFMTGAAQAAVTASDMKSRAAARLGAAPSEVRKMPFGLWEIVMGADQIFYADEQLRYLIQGDVIDLAARENLTQKRKDALLKVDWKSLPEANALKAVHGSGRYEVAVFADASCMYCRLLESYFAKMQDVTVRTYVFPMRQSRDLAEGVICAPDPAKAWSALMLRNEKPEKRVCDASELDRNAALAAKIGVTGTPTIVFPDGSRFGGVPPEEDLVRAIRKGSAR